MMKKVLIQNHKYSKKLDHDYNILESKGETKLLYSNNAEWDQNVRDTLAAEMFDDRNGLIIKLDSLKNKIKLDYSQANQLFILLKNNNKKWKVKIK